MKLDQRVWIPIIGIVYGLREGYITESEEWLKYQLMCCLIFLLMSSICW